MTSTQDRGSGPGVPQAARGPNLAHVLVGGVKDPSPFPPHMMTRALPPGQGFRSRPEGEQGLRGFEGRRVFFDTSTPHSELLWSQGHTNNNINQVTSEAT